VAAGNWSQLVAFPAVKGSNWLIGASIVTDHVGDERKSPDGRYRRPDPVTPSAGIKRFDSARFSQPPPFDCATTRGGASSAPILAYYVNSPRRSWKTQIGKKKGKQPNSFIFYFSIWEFFWFIGDLIYTNFLSICFGFRVKWFRARSSSAQMEF
jgi:hypothetical protein